MSIVFRSHLNFLRICMKDILIIYFFNLIDIDSCFIGPEYCTALFYILSDMMQKTCVRSIDLFCVLNVSTS